MHELYSLLAMAFQWVVFQFAFKGDFLFMGLNWGTYMYYTHIVGQLNIANPLEVIFPTTTGCTFNYISGGGTPAKVQAYCNMSMNSLYIYIIPLLWFILATLTILMALSLGFELLMLPCLPIRRGLMMFASVVMKGFKYRWEYDAIWKNATPAEYHLIRIYSNNVDPQIIRLFLIGIASGNRSLSSDEKKFLEKIA